MDDEHKSSLTGVTNPFPHRGSRLFGLLIAHCLTERFIFYTHLYKCLPSLFFAPPVPRSLGGRRLGYDLADIDVDWFPRRRVFGEGVARQADGAGTI